jgi:hypothetical protein
MGPNPTDDEVASLCFIDHEQKSQITSKKQVLEQR